MDTARTVTAKLLRWHHRPKKPEEEMGSRKAPSANASSCLPWVLAGCGKAMSLSTKHPGTAWSTLNPWVVLILFTRFLPATNLNTIWHGAGGRLPGDHFPTRPGVPPSTQYYCVKKKKVSHRSHSLESLNCQNVLEWSNCKEDSGQSFKPWQSLPLQSWSKSRK